MEKKILIKDVCCALCAVVFVCLMGFLASRWSLFWAYVKCGETYSYFIGDRLKDCMELSLCAIKEEVIFRFIPILVATSLIMIIKSPLAKKITIGLSIIIIIMIQLQFGYYHISPEFGDNDYWFHIKLQGGVGIMLVMVYCIIFLLAMKRFYKKSKHPIPTFTMCHIFSILASATAHIINNCLVIIAKTF